MTKREILADGLLLLTALIWGCAFSVVKNALDSFPPGAIIAMRYLIAAAITGALFHKRLRGLTRGDVARGALVGLALFGAYIVQPIGLQYTTAGKNAFLTTIYVLLVPFGCALLFHQKLQKGNLIAAVLMLVGIGLLSLDGQAGGLNVGDLLTLACGFLFAAHIIAEEQCQKKTNTYALIVLQFAFCGLYAAVYSLTFERGMPMTFSPGSVGGLLYIAVFSTTIGMSLQNIGQSMAPASHAVILLSLESVFGVLFSCLLLGEKVTPQMGVGFAVYMYGMMGSAVNEISSDASGSISMGDAMKTLGLTLSGGQMAIFAVQLFLTIAIGLSVSLILGAMATDTKSVQTLVLPIMMITMIPFFVTMFADVNSLSPIPRIILYIIPFTHTYTAMNNMLFGHMGLVWVGLIYQLVFFAVCMYLAVKIFTTDLLFTMSLPVKSAAKAPKKK